MRAAGYEDGLGVSRALMRRIAEDASRQYFVDGDVATGEGGVKLTARIRNTETGEQEATLEAPVPVAG